MVVRSTTGVVFVKPDSVLAQTAREMVAAHFGGEGSRDGQTMCPTCGDPLPCPAGRAAAEVLSAAGLAQASQASGLVQASRQGTPDGPGMPPSPFGPSPLGQGAGPLGQGAGPLGQGAGPLGQGAGPLGQGAGPLGQGGGAGPVSQGPAPLGHPLRAPGDGHPAQQDLGSSPAGPPSADAAPPSEPPFNRPNAATSGPARLPGFKGWAEINEEPAQPRHNATAEPRPDGPGGFGPSAGAPGGATRPAPQPVQPGTPHGPRPNQPFGSPENRQVGQFRTQPQPVQPQPVSPQPVQPASPSPSFRSASRPQDLPGPFDSTDGRSQRERPTDSGLPSTADQPPSGLPQLSSDQRTDGPAT